MGMLTERSVSRLLLSGGTSLQKLNRKRLSRVVALARYDDNRDRSSRIGSELSSKQLVDAMAALADYDDENPAEALAALEIDGEQWNRPLFEKRRADLLAKIGAT